MNAQEWTTKAPEVKTLFDAKNVLDKMAELRNLKGQIEDAIKAGQGAVMEYMGKHNLVELNVNGTSAKIARYDTVVFNRARFAEERPRLYEKYLDKKPTERFSFRN